MAAAQVTERLATLAQQLGERIRSLPYKTVHRLLCGLLILWLLVSLVQLVLVLLPSAPVDSAAPSLDSPVPPAPSVTVDIDKLQGIALFGDADGSVPAADILPIQDEVDVNATKTRLNLLLEGIVHTADAASSVAVIVYQGTQDQYYVGDKLPVGSRVELAKVLIDHVILDNAGTYESLWLYDDEKQAGPAEPVVRRRVQPVARAVVTDIRDDEEITELATDYRERLYKNPSSLAEVLRIAPAQQDGEMIGYRVSPGRDKQQFTELGFESNDIVTSINGITLDEPAKALEIYKLMRTATEATFTVERNGEPVEVMVSLEQ